MDIELKLTKALPGDEAKAMAIINMGKRFLKAQGVNQWQTGYPDLTCIEQDIQSQTGYFLTDNGEALAYLCVDFGGEPSYDGLQGAWHTETPYVVVHRMAISDAARGKNAACQAFALVEALSRQRGVFSFRVDTDEDNHIMRHVLEKCGFAYAGSIWFDNSRKIAFDKRIARAGD